MSLKERIEPTQKLLATLKKSVSNIDLEVLETRQASALDLIVWMQCLFENQLALIKTVMEMAPDDPLTCIHGEKDACDICDAGDMNAIFEAQARELKQRKEDVAFLRTELAKARKKLEPQPECFYCGNDTTRCPESPDGKHYPEAKS